MSDQPRAGQVERVSVAEARSLYPFHTLFACDETLGWYPVVLTKKASRWQRFLAWNRKPMPAERRAANVSLVREAIDRWQLQNDPADDLGITLHEFIVAVLEQERRLR